MTVHVVKVVFSSMPKKRLTSQKPESLTCERTMRLVVDEAADAVARQDPAG